MSSMFTSLLPFLKALQWQDMPSPEDEDGSNPPADQLDSAGSAAPSEENGGAAAAAQSNPVSNTVPGTAQRPVPQQSQNTKGDQLMRLLRSGLQGTNPNPLQALAPLAQSNAAPPLGVMPDGSLVQDMGYLQNAPLRIPQAGPDVTPNFNVSDPNQTRATLNQLVQGIGGQAPPLGVLPDGSLVQDMGYLKNAPSRISQGPDVTPNLNVSDPNQTRATLNQLVQGIGDQTPPFGVLPDGTLYGDMGYLRPPVQQQPRQPQQPRRLTAAEQQAAAAVAYSESTRGTVAEHEAVISVILNRAESGERQYVPRGRHVTVNNVIHAPNQFQGVDVPGPRGHNFRDFAGITDRGSQNARTAADNVARNGPTTNATAFLATGGTLPRADQVRALGNVHAVGRVGNIFLYAPGPAPAASAR